MGAFDLRGGMPGIGGVNMKKTIQQEVDAMITEMASLKDFDDDVFIQYFEKVDELQERIASQGEAEGLTEEERRSCAERLAAAFEGMKGKLSFCTL